MKGHCSSPKAGDSPRHQAAHPRRAWLETGRPGNTPGKAASQERREPAHPPRPGLMTKRGLAQKTASGLAQWLLSGRRAWPWAALLLA